MFDAIYKACRDKFSTRTAELTGNFIILFTDGEDNSSHVWEGEAVDMCATRPHSGIRFRSTVEGTCFSRPADT